MATPHKLVILSLVFLILLTSSESSRLLINAGALQVHSAPSKPALNLALPGDDIATFPGKPWTSFGRKSGAGERTSYSGRSFQQMFLNALPKGPVPSSGPSKGTNDSNA